VAGIRPMRGRGGENASKWRTKEGTETDHLKKGRRAGPLTERKNKIDLTNRADGTYAETQHGGKDVFWIKKNVR